MRNILRRGHGLNPALSGTSLRPKAPLRLIYISSHGGDTMDREITVRYPIIGVTTNATFGVGLRPRKQGSAVAKGCGVT